MRLTTLRGVELDRLTLNVDHDVRASMTAMNETGRTLTLVVDDGVLRGVVSDGDIRRHLARGGSVDDPIDKVVNFSPVTVPAGSSPEAIRASMIRHGLDYVPILDDRSPVGLCALESVPRSTELSAFVLAGGLGSRLAPLTDDCPKPLLPLGDQPILSHIIAHLREQGVARFVMSVNYLSEAITDYYDDGSALDVFVEYVHETKRLGTGGSLGLVDPEALSDPFVCINGDIVSDIDVGALLDKHVSNNFDATMVVRPHRYTVPYGVVQTDEQGEFGGIEEKPVLNFQINAGIYMLSKTVLEAVPRDEFYDMPTLFDDLPRRGLRGGVYSHEGRWIDVGTRQEYDRARAIFDETGSSR